MFMIRDGRRFFQKLILSKAILLILCLCAQTPVVGQSESLNLRPFPNAGPQLRAILERGVLRVGIQQNYKPFHIENPVGDHPGIDVELAEAIAETLGVRVEYQYGNVRELLEMLNQSQAIDIALGGISSSLYRSRYVYFTDPYLVTTPAALLSRRRLPNEAGTEDFQRREIESLADLRYIPGIKVGVMKDTVNARILASDRIFRRHTIVSFDNREALLSALVDGDIDALVADEIYIRAETLQNQSLLNRFLPLTEEYREEYVCIAMPYGDPSFQNVMNLIVRELERTGSLAEWRQNYLESRDWVR